MGRDSASASKCSPTMAHTCQRPREMQHLWNELYTEKVPAIVSQVMDIHSGGEDLRFPHHDNELAQAEAHYHDA